MSDKIKVDTLVINYPERNQIYSTELRMKGEVSETVLVNIEGIKNLQLPPGIYDSLIYKGDWYGNPMVLEVKGNSGTQLEFCANFYF
ncbi:hypothetical protein [Aquiflexum gelatinilyticum]|uniref:hypothetical protein n=1 Tax=Aquiflexum gelatinilyticum TaxID=2961943 RepID=UPI00216850AD|nr:hypothetical protein [Aquiflexum gelatinilyticum]MCS4433996.1 hypothetical protein [Aquiflexum gelatinilyticum]